MSLYTFNGPVNEHDTKRLSKQHEVIRDLMLDSRWRTLPEIANTTSYPEASISAQLRHLRKPRFGSYLVRKRRRTSDQSGLWEYQVEAPVPAGANFSFQF